MSILELFCSVDDFWQQFASQWQQSLLVAGQRKRLRATQMYPSEMKTIVILFQQSHSRTFKAYYNVCPIEHSRHRSPINFLVHLIAGLIAYCQQPKKPSLHFQSIKL
jgi:cytochrome c1